MAATTALAVLAFSGCAPDTGEPTDSPTPAATSSEPTTPAATAPGPVAERLVLFYVAYGDEGTVGEPIGCGDSLVGIVTEPVTTADPLRESMERLLAGTSRDLGTTGLHSALPGGTLAYTDGGLGADGVVTVELTGLPSPAGSCDNPRIEAQLERTAMEAVGASEALVLVDGVPIEDVLSLQ
ncbi:hypothetical protein GJ743_02075 [Agromyces bracchium]|uniref:GerMN domain-containing protein n=1 Tax=Agromyces bracchium TaxID=88376 RepID=A0A6I3LX84_9MICO|nr:hypothetical protein [Agromyces bracchium]